MEVGLTSAGAHVCMVLCSYDVWCVYMCVYNVCMCVCMCVCVGGGGVGECMYVCV